MSLFVVIWPGIPGMYIVNDEVEEGGRRMIGVKLTILMIVVTFVYIFLAKVKVKNESAEVKLRMLMKDEVPGYVFLIGILVILDFIGIIYSVIYLLFFMKW